MRSGPDAGRPARRLCESVTLTFGTTQLKSSEAVSRTVANSPSKFVAVTIDSVAAETVVPSGDSRSKVCVASIAKNVS